MTTRILKVCIIFILALAPHLLLAQAARGTAAPTIPGQNLNGVRVYLWAGLKTHGEGLHDYPQWLADWSKLLTQKGAFVTGALQPPGAADLEKTDVIMVYKGDSGYLTEAMKPAMDAYLKRGGGFITFHDSLCGPDPAAYALLVGGGKKHGERNFSAGKMTYNIVDKTHPIMKEMTDLTIGDEAFFLMTWAKDPAIHVLATVAMPENDIGEHKGEVVPQMWTYERTVPGGTAPARSFAWMQGHTYTNFSIPAIQNTILRAIAWVGKRQVEELVSYVQPAQQRGGRGGRGNAGAGATKQ